MRKLLLVVLFTSIAVPAAAQNRGFIALRGFRDVDSTHAGLPVGLGVGASAGVDITKHISLVVDVDEPEGRSRTETNETTDSVKGRQRITLTRIDRSPSFNVLVAVRGFADRRVSVAVSGGVTWTGHRSAFGVTIETLARDGTVTETVDHPAAWTSYLWFGLAGGVEVPIRVSQHVWIVPECRGNYFPLSESGPTIGRTGVNVRWRF